MSAKLSLGVGAAPTEATDDALRHMEREVDEFGRQEQWPEALTFRIHLIIEELGLNAMTYGGSSDVEVTITSEADAVVIEISDDGSPFDPLQDAPEPDVHAALEDRPIGGLGVHLVRTLTDEMSYRREGGRNRLTLVTRRVE